jgi:flagellar hook assembly protein FlgD
LSVALYNDAEVLVLQPRNRILVENGWVTVPIDLTTLAAGSYTFRVTAASRNGLAVATLSGVLHKDDVKPLINQLTTTGSVTHESHRRFTKLTFSLSEDAFVKAVVVNDRGQAVRTVANAQFLRAGTNALYWNGEDVHGKIVADGTYKVRLTATDRAGLVSDLATVTVDVDMVNPTIRGIKSNLSTLLVKQNNQLIISFDLSEDANVDIKWFTPDNQQLMIALSGPLKKGRQQLVWNGKSNEGRYVPNGPYTLRVNAKDRFHKSAQEVRLTVPLEVDFR